MNTRCPGCGVGGGRTFLELAQVPVFCNVLWPSRDEALAAGRADIALTACGGCGLIHNAAFDPRLLRYTPDYENPLHHSPRFRRYAAALAERLVEGYALAGKSIVEIGCGDGAFLAALCKLGGSRGFGFDPGYRPDESAAGCPEAVTIVAEPYSRAHARLPADFVCCRHVLEHVAAPVEFLTELREIIGGRRGTSVFFEVPNALHMLRGLGIWDIIYEHCSYFTPASLTNAFVRAGFEPTRVAEAYEGQFLTVEARPADGWGGPDRPRADAQLQGLLARFAGAYRDKSARWLERLLQFKREGARVAVWGGGSKGVSFLNALPAGEVLVEYVVDLNPRKQGRFVAGTAQQVVGPDFLRHHRPDVVVVMNPIYRDEIRRMLAEVAVDAELVVA